MGIITRHIEVPDLWRYKPEFYADGTERHIFCEGARYHVLSYSSSGTRCSAPKCEYNLPQSERIRLVVDAAIARVEAQPSNNSGASGSPSSYRARPSDPDLNPVSVKDLSASASPATKEQQ